MKENGKKLAIWGILLQFGLIGKGSRLLEVLFGISITQYANVASIVSIIFGIIRMVQRKKT